jgi:succinoglycan biosynthesis transport protein ExoP
VLTDTTASDVGSTRSPGRAGFTTRDLLTPVFYYGRIALLIFLIPVVLSLGLAVTAKPVFTAQSRLLILLGDDYIFRGTVNSSGPGLTFDRAQIVNAEMEILKSKDIQTQAIRLVGMSRVYPALRNDQQGLNQALEQLGKDLRIENVPASNVIELGLRNRNAAVSAELLNALVDLYIKRRREIFERSDVKVIREQEADLRSRLTALEARIASVSSASGIGDYSQELVTTQTRQTTLIAQLQGMDQQISQAGGREGRLDKDLKETAPVITLNTDLARSQQLEALTTALSAVDEQRRVAAAKYRDGHPLVAELDRQIAGLQAAVSAAPQQEAALIRKGVNPVYQDLGTQLAATRGEAAALTAGRQQALDALNENAARLQSLIEVGPVYRELLRNRALLEGAYQDIARKAEDARLEGALAGAQANVRIVERAQPPSRGQTGRAIILAAGLMLGLASALSLIVVSAATSQIMVSPADAEAKLDLPVLVTVPRSEDDLARSPLWRPLLSRMTADDVNLLQRLLRSLVGEDSGVIQWISADDGEGVSSLGLDMAIYRAQRTTGRVLIVDVEPQDGQSMAARIQRQGGRLDPVEDMRNLFQVDRSNLHVTGPMTRSGQSLSDDRWLAFMKQARQDYSLIVMDSPAVQRSSAGILVAPLADITLVVVEAESTRAPVIQNLVRRIEAGGGAVFGAVLNKRRFFIPRFVYSKI